MRHGERMDKSLNPLERLSQEWSLSDPVITSSGCQMAYDYGVMLR